MPMPALRSLTVALAALGGLAAAEPMAPALHLGMATAQGDFRNEMGNHAAWDLGLSLAVPLTRTLTLRPGASYQAFPTLDNKYAYRSSRYSDVGAESARWSAWTLGTDLLYRPSGPEGRFYFLLGGHMKSWRLHSFGTYTTSDVLNSSRTYTVNDTGTKNEPAVSMGLGWTFNRHLSLEAHSVLASYRGLSYNTLQASAVFSY